MGITNSNKTLSTDRIDCGGSFRVQLTLTAEPDIVTNPTDIVLILDRSGTVEANESISYDDAEGNVVTFPRAGRGL